MQNAVAAAADQPGSDRTATDTSQLRILVVDDDETNRTVLQLMLRKDGHSVCFASNGQEAVVVFQKEQPDLILMDVMMPVMNGYEATRIIKEMAAPHVIPIIFITAATDEKALVKCLEVGGDDFLTKPLSRVILRAKVAAADRMRRIYLEMERQQRDLSAHHERLRNEHELAEHIFTRVKTHADYQDSNVKVRQSPMAITNGDMVLVARGPGGVQRILLGDSTGHGLSAAIGAIPVSDVFYAMTHKGFSIRETIIEMNGKLYDTLPTGQFVAACVVDWHYPSGKMEIWNGGIPDVLLVDRKAGELIRIPSRNIPLGILNNDELSLDIEVCDVNPGDHFYLYSDGVIDARDRDGVEFGQSRLEALISDYEGADQAFAKVCGAIEQYSGDESQEDDITLVEVLCDTNLLIGEDLSEAKASKSFDVDRTISLCLGPREFQSFDPLTIVAMLTDGVGSLEKQRTLIYTILRELYANALEHGVLKLNTAVKNDPEGFTLYYDQREMRLAEIDSGWVRIDVSCTGDNAEGEMIIQVEDSGEGFVEDLTPSRSSQADIGIGGRGVALVRSLCTSLEYGKNGSHVRAVYAWPQSPHVAE